VQFRGSPRTVPSKPDSPEQGRVLRRREVEKKVGHGHSWLYAEMRAGRFPAPLEIGTRSVGWLESEIDSWIASRPRRRRA
jgi:prophage regulatory protein